MKKQTIYLTTKDGREAVEAYVVGQIGVHRGLDSRDWILTHIPTGCSLPGRLSPHPKRAQAVAVAQAVEAKMQDKEAWWSDDPYAVYDGLAAMMAEIRQAVEEILKQA